MKKLALSVLFLILSFPVLGQVEVKYFNAAWNAGNEVEWIEKLSDCEIYTPYGDAEVFDNKIDGIREILRGRSKEKPIGESKL